MYERHTVVPGLPGGVWVRKALASDVDLATCVARVVPGQTFNQSGFATTVLPDERVHFASKYLETNVGQRHLTGVGLSEVTQSQSRWAGSNSRRHLRKLAQLTPQRVLYSGRTSMSPSHGPDAGALSLVSTLVWTFCSTGFCPAKILLSWSVSA